MICEEKDMHTIYYCFPQGKNKVLTMSYDDAKVQDQRLIQLFNKFHIKGTFHINGGWIGNEGNIGRESIASLYKGHEIACHTFTHPTLERCPKEQIIQQVFKDREILEEIIDKPVRGLSYPNGSYNEEIKKLLPYLGIAYARTVHSTRKFEMPNDWLEWNPTCHHNEEIMEFARRFVEIQKRQYIYLLYVWGHSYEFDRDNNWHVIEEFCEYVSNREDIWYATNIEIVDYLKAVHGLVYTVKGDKVYNPSTIDVWLSVDDKIIKAKGGEYTRLY